MKPGMQQCMPSSRSDLRALGSWIGHFQEQRTRFSKLQLALPAGLGPWNQQIDRRHGHSCTSIVLFRALTICSTGLYWQISPAPSGAILHSRSLDGEMLTLPTDIPRRGQMQVRHLSGPQGSSPHCAASRKERTSNGKF